MREETAMKVLIIDDDVVSRMMLMHLVDSCVRADIFEAEDGEDAWRQLAAGLEPDICFCDLRMPRLSGMELLARVRADARLATLPFVLVSGANEREVVEQAGGLGATGYIVKPFDAGQVRAYLAGAAGQGGAGGDEAPADTARRLGIDGARLLLYFGGLRRQLAGAGAGLAPLLASGDGAAVRDRLARLREGCATLGLERAAARLAALEATAPGRLDAGEVERALEAALGDAERQTGRARAL
jgi:two-component system chemotaxis response regulator CheY